ncbi:MAG: hypothetical protein EpisKO_03970 [Epibacterium sp.]
MGQVTKTTSSLASATTQASYARKPRKCPNCGATPVANILYGMPSISPKLIEKEERGEVMFGGCVIEEDGSQAHWACSKCGAEFYKKK